MHRLLWVGLLGLAGCTGTTGPRMRDPNLMRVDPRGLPIQQQLDRARANLPYSNLTMPPNSEPRNWATLPEEQYGQRFNQ
jgi:hypothetical protein